jgi:tRNA (guanine37-N1)-methyltransferase
MVRCVRVPKAEGNKVRMALKSAGRLDLDAKIGTDGDNLLIPFIGEPPYGYEVTEAELRPLEHRETDYRMLLPDDVRDRLPSSYDIIGDILIIKLEDDILPLRSDVGKALMVTSPSTRLVLLDKGVKGELRIRDLEVIAGTGTTETQHRESGVSILTDPAKVYYNPRLATERERVASLVRDGEVIIDMFAGVAPFPLTICKHAHPKVVYAIDLNHDAVEYARRNVNLNKMPNIIPIEGDARYAIRDLPDADRVIMNLPQIADEFLPDALRKTVPGGTVHMHKILERVDADTWADDIVRRMADEGVGCHLVRMTELKTYSPSASVYVFDIVKN